jgi:hypothetical protein
MFQSRIVASTLVAIVSVPGFLVGQKLKQGDMSSVVGLLACLLTMIVLASAIMRQSGEP